MKPTYIIGGKIAVSKRAALGEMVICWAILEQTVEQVIWALKGIKRKAGRKITSNWRLQQRLEIMVKEAHSRLPKNEAGVFDGLADLTKSLAKERNWAAHGLWGKGALPGTKRKTYAVTYFRKPDGKAREMSEAYLKNLTRRINHQIYIFNGIIRHHIGFVP